MPSSTGGAEIELKEERVLKMAALEFS
jgi:hypothetical protein